MKKIPILFLSVTTIMGGGSEVIYTLAKALNGKKISATEELEIIVGAPHDGVYFSLMRDAGITVYDIPLRSLRAGNLVDIWRICTRHHIKLIHTHGKGAGLFGRLVSLFKLTPVIHTFHGFHFEHLPRLTRGLYAAYEAIFSWMTTALLFVSEGEKAKFINHTIGARTRKSAVIHNGISPDRLPSVRLTKSHFGFANDDILVITTARISKQKGLIYIAEALHILQQRTKHGKKIKFIIAGDDLHAEAAQGEARYREELFKTRDDLDLRDTLLIREKSADVLQLVAVCDIFVSASLGEGFSLSLIEAMLLGLPVVATNVTGNNEAIEHLHSGLLIDARSAIAIAQALELLINQPDLAAQFGSKAKQRAQSLFSYEGMIQNTLTVYTNALRR